MVVLGWGDVGRVGNSLLDCILNLPASFLELIIQSCEFQLCRQVVGICGKAVRRPHGVGLFAALCGYFVARLVLRCWSSNCAT